MAEKKETKKPEKKTTKKPEKAVKVQKKAKPTEKKKVAKSDKTVKVQKKTEAKKENIVSQAENPETKTKEKSRKELRENKRAEAKAKKEKAQELKPEPKKEFSLKIMHLKPLVTEKAVMLIESQNVLAFETSISSKKDKIRDEVEQIFEVKVEDVRTLIRKGKKYAYVKLNSKTPAIDIATKLGMI